MTYTSPVYRRFRPLHDLSRRIETVRLYDQGTHRILRPKHIFRWGTLPRVAPEVPFPESSPLPDSSARSTKADPSAPSASSTAPLSEHSEDGRLHRSDSSFSVQL